MPELPRPRTRRHRPQVQQVEHDEGSKTLRPSASSPRARRLDISFGGVTPIGRAGRLMRVSWSVLGELERHADEQDDPHDPSSWL